MWGPFAIAWAVLFAADPATSAPAATYLREVQPVLKHRCWACHGALQQQSDLRLDTVAAMTTGDQHRVSRRESAPQTDHRG
jgi:hypothetical protein